MFSIAAVKDRPTRPYGLELRSSKWFILVVISLSVFTDLFLYGIIVPVIPFALETRVHVAPEHVQYWVSVLLATYGAALLAGSPVSGYLADRTSSRRWPYLLGLLFLSVSTAMLCIGTSLALLVVGRIMQGLSAAVVWVVGLALIVDTVGPKDVGQMMGYVGIAMSLAILVAPLLGGVVYARAGYYAVFAMAFALLGVDTVLRLMMIERKVALKWLEADTTCIEEAGIQDTKLPEKTVPVKDNEFEINQTSPASLQAELISPDPAEPQATTPVHKSTRLPPVITLLKSSRLLAALWATLVVAGLISAFDAVLPIRVRLIFHWDSLGAGLIFLATITPTFISPLVGALSDRHGPRYLATAGFLIGVPPYACLRFVDHDSIAQKALLCGLLVLCGISLVFAMAPLMAEVCYAVEAKEARHPGMFGKRGAYAQAYALFNMAFAGGTLWGPIWGGLVNQTAGWATMSWTLALLCGVTAVPTVLWVGGWIGGKKEVRHSRREVDGAVVVA